MVLIKNEKKKKNCVSIAKHAINHFSFKMAFILHILRITSFMHFCDANDTKNERTHKMSHLCALQ